jgi:methylglutaconyl-CoA hydratase
MQFETLLLDTTEHLSTITLNRPEKRNAITTQMIADLQSALDAIEKTNTRVVIITGAGKAFCAGIDLELLQAIAQQTPAENQDDSRRIAKMFRKIWSYSRPMIAAVNGHALAGGCGIATLCDFTLSVPEAKFGYTEVKIGFLPAIVSVFLSRQIGEKRCRDLLLTGRLVEASEAKELGLVNEIVSSERLVDRAPSICSFPQPLLASIMTWSAPSWKALASAALPTSRKASPHSSKSASPSGRATRKSIEPSCLSGQWKLACCHSERSLQSEESAFSLALRKANPSLCSG